MGDSRLWSVRTVILVIGSVRTVILTCTSKSASGIITG